MPNTHPAQPANEAHGCCVVTVLFGGSSSGFYGLTIAFLEPTTDFLLLSFRYKMTQLFKQRRANNLFR